MIEGKSYFDAIYPFDLYLEEPAVGIQSRKLRSVFAVVNTRIHTR